MSSNAFFDSKQIVQRIANDLRDLRMAYGQGYTATHSGHGLHELAFNLLESIEAINMTPEQFDTNSEELLEIARTDLVRHIRAISQAFNALDSKAREAVRVDYRVNLQEKVARAQKIGVDQSELRRLRSNMMELGLV